MLVSSLVYLLFLIVVGARRRDTYTCLCFTAMQPLGYRGKASAPPGVNEFAPTVAITEQPQDDTASAEDAGLIGQQTHHAELRRQDERLDSISVVLQRLGEIARDVSAEVTSQEQIIAAIDTETENAQAATNYLNRDVALLIRNNGGVYWCSTLAVLTVVAIALFLYIVFYY